MTTIRKYYLKNLECANCAERIEQSVQGLPGVQFANVNFSTSILHINADNFSLVADAIKQVEPTVEVFTKDQDQPYFDSQSRKEITLIGTALVFLIFGLIFEDQNHDLSTKIGEILVFGTAYLLSGAGVLRRAYLNVRRGNWFDETFLMSVSTLGAIAINEFPEAVGVMLFYQVGEFIQRLSVNRSRRSIQSLMDVRPDTANLKTEDGIQSVSPDQVRVGEFIIVRPGEKVPLDGQVQKGETQLDLSALTGESTPVLIIPGDEVLAGSINQTGLINVEVLKPFEESSVSKMLELVQNASARKAKTQRFITRFAKVYSPIMVGIALAVGLIPPLFFGESLSVWIYRALVILVVSCPCALVISIPLGYFGGIGGASRRGILVKGANFLDVLADVKTVVFDKTGTLTRGVFKVTHIEPFNGWDEKELLRVTAIAESQSNHPVAISIKQAYGETLPKNGVEYLEEFAGFGVRARVNGIVVLVGNDTFMHKENITHETCDIQGTVAHVAVDREYAGYLIVSDELKAEAEFGIQNLHQIGVDEVIMLSGDRENVAENVANKLGLDDFYAELLPEDKVTVMEELMNTRDSGKVAFVGEGINDAPALSRADVGIAMGAFGADVAIEIADVVLMTDSPAKVSEAIQIGRRTRKIVWQNIYLALGVKTVFVILGILGVATMWEAVFGDVGVTILAVLNATRVLK